MAHQVKDWAALGHPDRCASRPAAQSVGNDLGSPPGPGVWVNNYFDEWTPVKLSGPTDTAFVVQIANDTEGMRSVPADFDLVAFVRERVARLQRGGEAIQLFYIPVVNNEKGLAMYANLDFNGDLGVFLVGARGRFGPMWLERQAFVGSRTRYDIALVDK